MPCHSACGEGALGASARDDEGDDKVADEADCEAGEKKDEQGFFMFPEASIGFYPSNLLS